MRTYLKLKSLQLQYVYCCQHFGECKDIYHVALVIKKAVVCGLQKNANFHGPFVFYIINSQHDILCYLRHEINSISAFVLKSNNNNKNLGKSDFYVDSESISIYTQIILLLLLIAQESNVFLWAYKLRILTSAIDGRLNFYICIIANLSVRHFIKQ